ncbi:hypothetical protein PHYSODRAFT_454117, partial [Phytophthora sojae]
SIERALSRVRQLCSQMNEFQTSCERLYGRLQSLFKEILSAQQRPLATRESLVRYAKILSLYQRFLVCHRAKGFVHRVIAHQTLVGELRRLNEDVSVLFNSMGIEPHTDWQDPVEKDSRVLSVMTSDTSAVLHELQEPRAQVEAWLTLKFEVE